MHERIAELERELRLKDKRIDELKAELDEQRALVHEMEVHVKDDREHFENFIQTFSLVVTNDGTWTDGESIGDVRLRYNKLVGIIDRHIAWLRNGLRRTRSEPPPR